MGKLLRRLSNLSKLLAVFTLSVMTVYLLLSVNVAFGAANHYARMTGWAHAYLLVGASGDYDWAGDFANHPPGGCNPDDPAGYWAWNTRIDMVTPSSVPFRFSDNSSYTRSSFYLNDNGDPNCSMGHYWADIYFSHAKQPLSGCYCDGFTSCVLGSNGVNNCQQAIDWGSSYRTYSGP